MTDGPFKNLNLARCWKRLAAAVQNDAASPQDCTALASDALAQNLVTKEHLKALEEIVAHLSGDQLDFDPLGSVGAILERCEKTSFLDTFRKELLYRTAQDIPLGHALAPALDAAIAKHVEESRNRFHEEFIRAAEVGEMSRSSADRARVKTDAAFGRVEISEVRDALLAGRKDAFKMHFSGSGGVDEGMFRL